MAFKLDRSKLDALIGQINAAKFQEDFGNRGPGGMFAGASAPTNYTAMETPTDPSFFQRALDVISRPIYATSNLVKDTIDPDPNTDNGFESLWAGLSGVDKTTGRDILNKYESVNNVEIPDWVKGVGGFVSDVALDPLTYTTFGIGTALKTSAKAASTALKGDKAFTEAIKAGKGLEEYSAKEMKLKGFPQGKTPAPAKVAEESVQAQAAATNAGRRDAIADEVVADTATNPASSIPHLDDLSAPTPVVPTPKPSQTRLGNDFEQSRLTQDLTNKTIRDVRADPAYSGLKFVERDKVIYDDLSGRLRDLKKDQISSGVYPAVRIGDNAYTLHISDVLDSLGETGRKLHLSKFDQVPTSSLLQGAARTIEGKIGGQTGDELLQAVTEQIIKGHKTKQVISPRRAEVAAKALIAKTDDLESRMIANEALIGKRDLVQGEAMGAKVAQDTKAAVDDPAVPASDTLKAVADVNGTIIRQGREAGVSPGGQAVGARRANESLKDTVAPTDTAGARATLGAAKDATKGAPEKVSARQSRQMDIDEPVVAAANAARYVDLGEHVAATLDTGVHRLYNGILGGFTHGHRMGEIAHTYRGQKSFVEKVQQQYNDDLSALSKQFDEHTLNAAYVALTSGLKGSDDAADVTGAAINGLRPLLEHMGLLTDDAADNAFVRLGLDADTVNELLKQKGLPQFEFKLKKGQTLADVASKQMKNWVVTKDLTNFLSRMQSAIMEGVARKEVGVDFARRFGSSTPKPGYVKIAKTDYEKSPMSHFIPQDKYYPREYVEQMRRFNKMIDAPTSFRGKTGTFAWFANNVIDPYLRLWKPTATIFRPGHHVRNYIGDGAMNFMAGVTNPKHYKYAAAAQLAGRELKVDYKTLQSTFKNPSDVPVADARKMFDVKLKSGSEPVNAAGLYNAALRNGTLVGYKSAEDILSSEGKNLLARGTDKIMESRVAQTAGKVSEGSANQHKLAQLSYMLNDPKFTSRFDSLDDAVREANKTILKYHPDIGGLSTLESKVGRRVIPFYTWMRQAIPTILSASLSRPGRLTAAPKAMYNFQVGMGMDPESLEEPYTNESLLPSFIREGLSGNADLGFLGNSTFNLGTPAETLNDVFSQGEESNPIKTIGSFIGESLNPAFTVIPETVKQEDVSGKYVSDVSENLDQAIPFLNQLSSLSGYSATGSIGNVFGGANVPVLDPQRAVEKGEKDILWNRNLLNFLTGLQIQDADRPSYQKYAVKENRG